MKEILLEFVVPSGSEHYIDLAHTMLYIQAKVELIEAEAENAKVAPVNNFLHSLFTQVDVFFNQKLVSPPNNAYPYRAYIVLRPETYYRFITNFKFLSFKIHF